MLAHEKRGHLLMKARKSRGLTLIELVVTVTVLAVIIALAMPSFSVLLANQRIRTATENLRAGLQGARVEALKRGQGVVFEMPILDSSWRYGCESPVADDNDGDGLPDCPSQIQVSASSVGDDSTLTIVTTPAGVSRVAFSPLGLVRQTVPVPFTQIDITVPNISASNLKPLRILLPAGGLSRICDPSVTDSGDTRKC